MTDDQQGGIVADVRFAIVPEWVLDLEVSDRAVRLYALLARHADGDGSGAIPGRKRLAKRLRCSVDSVDRAKAELVDAGALHVEHRFLDGRQTSNDYLVIRVPPGHPGRTAAADEGRTTAAPPGRTGAAGDNESQVDREPEDREASSLVPRDSSPEQAPEYPPEVRELALEFVGMVKANGHALPAKGSKAAATWLLELDRLRRLGPPGDTGDDPPPTDDEIREVMRWALQVSEFWPANIRAIPKFREKYTVLRAQMRRESNGRRRSTAPGPSAAANYEAAAAALRERRR
jgi:hypothetical protein